MTDIIAVLKSYLDDHTVVMSRRIVNDTIAEIERLRADIAHLVGANALERKRANSAEAERDALREALKPFALAADSEELDLYKDDDRAYGCLFKVGDLRRARAALKGDDSE